MVVLKKAVDRFVFCFVVAVHGDKVVDDQFSHELAPSYSGDVGYTAHSIAVRYVSYRHTGEWFVEKGKLFGGRGRRPTNIQPRPYNRADVITDAACRYPPALWKEWLMWAALLRYLESASTSSTACLNM